MDCRPGRHAHPQVRRCDEALSIDLVGAPVRILQVLFKRGRSLRPDTVHFVCIPTPNMLLNRPDSQT